MSVSSPTHIWCFPQNPACSARGCLPKRGAVPSAAAVPQLQALLFSSGSVATGLHVRRGEALRPPTWVSVRECWGHCWRPLDSGQLGSLPSMGSPDQQQRHPQGTVRNAERP